MNKYERERERLAAAVAGSADRVYSACRRHVPGIRPPRAATLYRCVRCQAEVLGGPMTVKLVAKGGQPCCLECMAIMLETEHDVSIIAKPGVSADVAADPDTVRYINQADAEPETN